MMFLEKQKQSHLLLEKNKTEQKDVTIEVTGVSMSGEAEINEHNRPVKSDKEEPEGEKS